MTANNPGLAEKRVKSGVSKVVYRSPPQWLTKKIAAAIKRLGGDTRACYPLVELLETMDRKYKTKGTSASFSSMRDHEGRTKVDGKLAYVFEPYLDSDDTRFRTLIEVLRVELDCNVEVSKTSWHYPEWTIRICFTEKTK